MARYKRHLFICENTRPDGHPRGSCAQRAGCDLAAAFKEELRRRGMSAQYRANKAGCLDACESGPVVVVYPDAVWYGGVTMDDIGEIIDSHIVGGVPVERLYMQDKRFHKTFDREGAEGEASSDASGSLSEAGG